MSFKLKYFVQSWVEIDFNGKVIHIDPSFIDKADKKMVEKADYIFITHHHGDHCDEEALKYISKDNTKLFFTELCKENLQEDGRILKAGESIEIGEFKVSAIPAYNTPDGNSTHKFHKKDECLGYIFEIDGKKIYHAGDTDIIEEMNLLKDIYIAMLPYGGTYTMDLREAVKATSIINPEYILPIHGREKSYKDFEKSVKNECNSKIISGKNNSIVEI